MQEGLLEDTVLELAMDQHPGVTAVIPATNYSVTAKSPSEAGGRPVGRGGTGAAAYRELGLLVSCVCATEGGESVTAVFHNKIFYL